MIVDVLEGRAAWHVAAGDCLDVMRAIPDASIDAIVTDPPAGISFMGKNWDDDKGGRDQWIAWLTERMREALRVLKPGGHALVWALPRTSHWTGMALENAGFEIRDRVSHLFGSGFPKSLDVSKGVDKLAGAERPIVGEWNMPGRGKRAESQAYGLTKDAGTITSPATAAAAAALQGWGTALKPACEDWWLCRKPFRGSIVKNVLEHGTGAINVGACRVGNDERVNEPMGGPENSYGGYGATATATLGRWPAHLLLSHAEGCERVGVRKVKAATPWGKNDRPPLFTGEDVSPIHYADDDGTETIDDWQCVDGCPVKELDSQSGALPVSGAARSGRPALAENTGMFLQGGSGNGTLHNDEGGASRYFTTFAPFFYTPKADRADRENGCEHMARRSGGKLTDRVDGSAGLDSPRAGAGRRGGRANHHPTVKSTDLMRWLVRLITPPRGIVLDCFAGSGSTGVACSAEGVRFIGIELAPEYAEIARARIVGDMPLFNVAGIK